MRRRRESVEKRERRESQVDEKSPLERMDSKDSLPDPWEGKLNESLSPETVQLRDGLQRKRRESVEKRRAEDRKDEDE